MLVDVKIFEFKKFRFWSGGFQTRIKQIPFKNWEEILKKLLYFERKLELANLNFGRGETEIFRKFCDRHRCTRCFTDKSWRK